MENTHKKCVCKLKAHLMHAWISHMTMKLKVILAFIIFIVTYYSFYVLGTPLLS